MTPPDDPARWQRVLRHCSQQLEQRRAEHSPAAPAGLQAGFLYSGQAHESVPRRLLLDNRLTPLERNAWQVLRLLLAGQGLVTPRYEDLQPHLSTLPCGGQASRETIARVLTLLRLTRWLSLVTRGRDPATGRLQGSLYVLHDEPLTPAEALELDTQYLALVGQCLSHGNRAIRRVAEHSLGELEQDALIERGHLPSRLQGFGERWQQQGLAEAPLPDTAGDHRVRIRTRPGTDSEPGPIAPSSASEPGLKSSTYPVVRFPNLDRTVQNTNTGIGIKTIPRAPATPAGLRWPTALPLDAAEQQAAAVALAKLPSAERQCVLDEAAARCAAGGIRRPAAYLMGLIQRALRGDFRPWLSPPATESGPASAPLPVMPVPPPERRTPGEPLSAQVQACLDELRQLNRGTGTRASNVAQPSALDRHAPAVAGAGPLA